MGESLDHIAGNLKRIRDSIAEAAEAANRPTDSVRLIAVSKTMPEAAVEAAYAAGQRLFGENRIQELERKHSALPADIEWHMIGHLQSNKTRNATGISALIHGVDRPRLVGRLAEAADEIDIVQPLLLQANVSGEASKFGIPPEDLDQLLEEALKLPRIEVRGLMTMAPFDAPEPLLHRIFASLREARDRLQDDFGVRLPELSMGMSGDYRIAIAEGATLVRIGTAIFGERGQP